MNAYLGRSLNASKWKSPLILSASKNKEAINDTKPIIIINKQKAVTNRSLSLYFLGIKSIVNKAINNKERKPIIYLK